MISDVFVHTIKMDMQFLWKLSEK